MFRGCGALSRKAAAERIDSLVQPRYAGLQRVLHCNRCTKNGSRYGATSVAGIPLKIATWIELAAQTICFTFFHDGATRLLEVVVDVGKGPAGFGPCVAQRIAQLREECRQCRHAVLREELAHRRALRRRSGDQVSQQQEAHRRNNSEMNVAKKKRWLRGGELLESRDICLKEELPQRLILSCICSITVSDLTLFFIPTRIYLHTYTHYNTYITSHHITSHLHYLPKCFRNSLQSGRLLGFPLPLVFSCYLQRVGCSISHLARCFSTVFDMWFLVLGGICDILEHGRGILHFGTSTCRLARYLQHFTPKITQTIVVFLLFLRSFAAVVVVIVCVSCVSCCSCRSCCSCCSCWFVVVAVLVVMVPVAVAVGEPEI